MKKRLLGAQEILFYAMNEASPKHFLLAAEMEGAITRDDWEAAALVLQAAHPLLNRSITQMEGSLYFSDAGNAGAFLEIDQLQEPIHLARLIEQELERGFVSNAGPLARVKLLHSEARSMVIIAAHHSIADAFSVLNLLDDLLAILAGKNLVRSDCAPSVDELLGLDNNGLASKINRQIIPGTPLPHPFVKQHPPATVDIVSFPPELTSRLSKAAKMNGTTVHGALQAAAALSIREVSFAESRPAYIMSPFSVRPDFKIGKDLGLFIDTKIVAVPTEEDANFWAIARAATEGLADIHSSAFLRTSAERLRQLVSQSDDLIQFIRDHFNFDIMLSNLGKLSFENDSPKLKVNSVVGPFIVSGLGNQQAIGVTTVKGKLTLVNTSRYLIPGLLSAMKEKINVACSSTPEPTHPISTP